LKIRKLYHKSNFGNGEKKSDPSTLGGVRVRGVCVGARKVT